MGKFLILLVVLFCFLPGAFCVSPVLPDDKKVFSTLEGDGLSYTDLTSFPKTILFLWTTWCPSCVKEFQRLSRKCSNFDRVEILYANIGQRKSVVRRFVKAKGLKECIREKIVLDADSYLAREFSVYAIPAFIFLKDGKFVYRSNFLNKKLVERVFGAE